MRREFRVYKEGTEEYVGKVYASHKVDAVAIACKLFLMKEEDIFVKGLHDYDGDPNFDEIHFNYLREAGDFELGVTSERGKDLYYSEFELVEQVMMYGYNFKEAKTIIMIARNCVFVAEDGGFGSHFTMDDAIYVICEALEATGISPLDENLGKLNYDDVNHGGLTAGDIEEFSDTLRSKVERPDLISSSKYFTMEDICILDKLENLYEGGQLDSDTYITCIRELSRIEKQVSVLLDARPWNNLPYFEQFLGDYEPVSERDKWTACLYNCDEIYLHAIELCVFGRDLGNI